MIRYYLGTIAIAFTILFTLSTGCKKDQPLQEEISTNTSDTTWTDSTTITGDSIIIDDTTDTIVVEILGCTDPIATNYNSEATDDDGSCEYPISPNANIDDLFEELRSSNQVVQEYSMLAEEGGQITCINGSQFNFYSNTFATLDGTPVTGQIEIEIIEVLTKGDILLIGRPTISDGQILRSAGEFYVSANQDGQELQMTGSYNISWPYANAFEDQGEMLFFEGEGQGEEFNWVLLQNTELWAGTGIIDSLEEEGGPVFNVFSDRFGWLNCDAFMSYLPEELTTISVTLPAEYTNVNTAVFIVFNDDNAVLPMYGDPTTEAFVSGQIPIGVDVTIVVVSSIGDPNDPQYQYDLIPITIEADQVIASIPEDATLDEIENAVSGL